MIAQSLQEAAGIDLAPSRKSGLRLAHELEQDLASSTWCDGRSLGSEIVLARKHGVSQPTARQAVRILEARDLGHTHRGRRGGFIVHRPSSTSLGRLMALHLTALNVPAEEVCRSRTLLLAALPAGGQSQHFARELLTSIADAMREVASYPAGQPCDRNRAAAVAQQMLVAFDGADSNLWTINQMEERYSAGRPIITQAVRILEQLDLVGTVRGRNGGLVRRVPNAATITKAALPHLRAYHVEDECYNLVIWTINGIAADIAAKAQRRNSYLDDLRIRLCCSKESESNRVLQVAVFRRLADLACMPVLHLLVRSLWLYEELNREPCLVSGALSARESTATIALIDAVVAGHDDAQHAVSKCYRAVADEAC